MRKLIFLSILFFHPFSGESQGKGGYPPHTRWYQDPLGLKPVELSSAFGFVWGSAAFAASLIFTGRDSSFIKRTSVYYDGGYGFGYKPPYTNVATNSIGMIYALRNWLSAGFEMNAFHFKDAINNTWTFGFRPFARWYAYKDKTLNLFFEYGAGVSYSLQKFPLTGTGLDVDTGRIGTRFNFTSKYGIGAELHLNSKMSLQAGARHNHLSNGNIDGIDRNPSHDNNGFFVGVIYAIKQ